jgi:hypothetical protein
MLQLQLPYGTREVGVCAPVWCLHDGLLVASNESLIVELRLHHSLDRWWLMVVPVVDESPLLIIFMDTNLTYYVVDKFNNLVSLITHRVSWCFLSLVTNLFGTVQVSEQHHASTIAQSYGDHQYVTNFWAIMTYVH